ncbi:MAG TPA: phage holin family protein [Solirubrobacteraceae bacterium]
MATDDSKNAAVKEPESGESSLGPYAEAFEWSPRAPRFRVAHLLLSWLLAGASVLIAAAVVPGVSVGSFGNAVAAAALIGVLNAVLPPIVAALRLPFTLALGFVSVLAVDALILLLVSDISPSAIHVASFGWALLAALVIAAAMVALEAVLGVNDDDTYSLRVIRRIARRQGPLPKATGPGIVFLEIDGLALPVLQRAMRDGNAPELARWVSDGTHQLLEWETDLSSQTGASQAGILLGSNEDVPAFRWVEKESRKLVACSSPQACAEIEGRLASGEGLLVSGGASRGNLFSGGADAVILTISRLSAEKRANPGYRPFLANGFNVTRLLVLVVWEVILERVAAIRQRRREVLPRGDRGGLYPFLRAAVCVGVRDLIVFGVLTDMMAGRPAVYATFSSYDEVAHHSGLERADTLEALRKVDQQIGRINRARRFAPRPYKLVVLSDHGQTQGATFKQRNGYDLQDLVQRSLGRAAVDQLRGGDENDVAVAHAVAEATGRRSTERAGDELGEGEAVVLASGNLALVYLMSATRRLSLEEIDHRYPGLLPSLRGHPDIGFLLVRSSEHGPVIMGGRGTRYLAEDRLVGEDPLAPFPPSAADHLRRSDGFPHAPDVLLNSFYSPELERGCAFEELISFHGGLGGPQTRPFILHPVELPAPAEPVVGAVSVHHLLSGWRQALQRDSTRLTAAEPAVGR